MKLLKLFGILLSIFLLFACSDGGGSGSGSGGSGALSLSLTDSTTDEYRAVYVTIRAVEVHLGGNENRPGNWLTVDLPDDPNTGSPKDRITVNLLELVNGVMEDLGIAELESGHYTQMRLIIDTVPDDSLNILSQPHPFANYVIDQNDPPNEYELKIPSGLKTGIKIVGGFNISTNETTELILDFDACRSVVQAGNSGIWLLKPTIKILYQYTIINGLVTDDTDDKNPIEGALVSAQIYDDKGTSELADDEVVVQASTITDEKGEYKLLVPPGTYNLVAFAETDTETYLPDVIKISTSEGSTAKNFTLSIWPTGTVSGLVSISGATSEEHATLSFQQDANLYCPLPECGDIEKVEVKAINVANNSTYETNLPQGTFADGTEYFLVATSIGYSPFTEDFEVIDDGNQTTVDVTVDVTLTGF